MLFESTKTLLRGIIQSLEKGDTSVWDDRLESGLQCQYELHQMSRSSTRAYKIGSVPIADRAIRAMSAAHASDTVPTGDEPQRVC